MYALDKASLHYPKRTCFPFRFAGAFTLSIPLKTHARQRLPWRAGCREHNPVTVFQAHIPSTAACRTARNRVLLCSRNIIPNCGKRKINGGRILDPYPAVSWCEDKLPLQRATAVWSQIGIRWSLPCCDRGRLRYGCSRPGTALKGDRNQSQTESRAEHLGRSKKRREGAGIRHSEANLSP